MARIKDWLIDMEAYTWAAIEANLSLNETIAYVKRHVNGVDEMYVCGVVSDYHAGEIL